MKKKMVISMAVLLLLTAIVFPMAEARGAMMDATGGCNISHVGKTVTIGGYTSSTDDEDTIRVIISLQEKIDGKWYTLTVKSKTEKNTDFVSVSKDYTVSGGHYYRVYATHYAKTGTVVCTTSSWTGSLWIPQ